MKICRHIALSLLVMASAASCVKESLDNCPPPPPVPEGELWITFDMLNTELEYNTRAVECLQLLFFDMDGAPSTDPATIGEPTPGTLKYSLPYTKDDLRPADGAALAEGIEAGDYLVLAIFNSDAHTITREEESFNTIYTHLVEDTYDFRPPNDFLTGTARITVTEDEAQEENIVLIRHNNDITLNIIYEGYEIPEGARLEAHIAGNNGAFDYSDHATPEDSYVESLPVEEPLVNGEGLPTQFKFTTMRLSHQRDVMIYLTEVPEAGGDEGRAAPPLDIAAYLAEESAAFDTDGELERYNEYEIDITLGAGLTVVSVDIRVLGWDEAGGGIKI